MVEKLTRGRLKEVVKYTKSTGEFRWADNFNSRARRGVECGKPKDNNYGVIKIEGVSYKTHRLAWLYIEGYFPEVDIDHKDRDKCNVKWKNLRLASRSCNLKNSNLRRNNKSGISGVSKSHNKWKVSIGHENKSIYLGSYLNFNDAATVRYMAELKYGYPDCTSYSSAYNYLRDNGLV